MENKTFKLEELNAEFWSKVILINIWPSSGVGGSGSLWIVTSDEKQYYISFETFPYAEGNLGEFTSILKKKKSIVDYAHPYEVEGNGWQYIPKERCLIRDDFYEKFIKTYNYYTNHYKGRGLTTRHMAILAGYALGVEGELERFNEEKAYLLWKKREEEYEKREEKRNSVALTKDDINWKELYPNNTPCFFKRGEYALIFKNVEERVVGHKFTILYQYEEFSPLVLSGTDVVEGYILLEEEFNDVQGPLYINDAEKDEKYNQAFDTACSMHNNIVNSYGNFIRAFKTIEEAKEYAVQVANIRGYANQWNLISGIDNKEIMYKNWNRKYQGILGFYKHYKEILEIVSKFQYESENIAGGGVIFKEILRETNIKEDLLEEMWQYVPLILTPQTQEKAKNIVEECQMNLK